MDRTYWLRRFGLLVVALLCSWQLFAQLGFQLEVSSNTIRKDEVLQVSYLVKNASQLNSRLSVSFPGWKIVSGPQTSQETSIINGVTSSSIGYVYLLLPTRSGNLTIPGATIMADGKKLTCAGTTIQVSNKTQGGGPISPNPQQGRGASGISGLQALLDQMAGRDEQPESDNVLHKGETIQQKINNNMFVRATPNKKTVYVGEPFVVNYQLYSALGGQSRVTAQPSFQGVSVLDLTKETQPEIVTVDGKRYRAFLIRKVQLIALHPGKISLGTVETSNEIPYSTYDNPYQSQTHTELLRNPEINVEAKALPTVGKPADFSGAVGKFQIFVSAQNASIPAGDNNTLRIEIRGEGNILPATIPNISWPAGIEHYDAKDSQSVDKRSFPIQVAKIFEVPFIGQKEGKTTFGPISFSYFDTDSGTYKTVQSSPFTVLFTAPSENKNNSNNDNSFGNNIQQIALIVGGCFGMVILGIIIFFTIKSFKKKANTKKLSTKESLHQKVDEAAPWNLDKQTNTSTHIENNAVVAEPSPSTTANTEEKDIVSESKRNNFRIELQKIMLSQSKSEMYERGSLLMEDILATYLHTSSKSKDQLLILLNQSTKPESEKQQVIHSVSQIQTQINKGLYSPFFEESDKLNLIDELNNLLLGTKL